MLIRQTVRSVFGQMMISHTQSMCSPKNDIEFSGIRLTCMLCRRFSISYTVSFALSRDV